MSKTEFTWENFRSKAIAVRCSSQHEAEEFLMFCKKFGFCWDSGAKIERNNTFYDVYGTQTCYIARADFPNIQYRSLSWVIEHGYYVRSEREAMAELVRSAVKPRIRVVGVACDGKDDSERFGITRSEGRTAEDVCPYKESDEYSAISRWRDAEADKPIRDGEFIVCYTKVEDCEFRRCVERVGYDLANGWDYIEEAVITHWLDGVPELPEVVVR